MSTTQLDSYEEIPYDSVAFFPTHPDNLATIATLFGMTPPAVEECRVLELGCADGGNLIPMAATLPRSRLLGIDLSPSHIARGQETIQALSLSNIELKPLSILDLHEESGLFDYIICHGVYSWVPAEVQDRILRICSRNLAPNGVAFVSYNVYPGWHIGNMIRDMMNFHVRNIANPKDRVSEARAFLDFLVQLVEQDSGNHLYGQVLADEAKHLRPDSDSYVFHEYLEEVNQPVYFHQFAERAAAKGLQYLSEARFNTMASNLPLELKEPLWKWAGNLINLEQYLDFARNRKFRVSLLCHQKVALNRDPQPETVMNLHVTALARPLAATADSSSSETEQFETPNGVTMSTNHPLVKTTIRTLHAVWPRSMSFAALWEAVQARLGVAANQFEARNLAETLLQCSMGNLVEMHVHVVPFVTDISSRPLACPLARHQAANGQWVTNRRHRNVELSALDRLVIRFLDGTRDRGAVLESLVETAANGLPVVGPDDQPVTEPGKVHTLLAEALTPSFRRLAGSALLIG